PYIGILQGRVRNMRRFSCMLPIAVCTLLLLVCCSVVGAQTETGQINGVVTDPQGATVAKAKIVIKNSATGAVRETESDDPVFYASSHLLPGVYEISAESTGFEKRVRRVEVPVGRKVTATLQMTLTGATTVVEVTAGTAAQVNIESQTLGAVINSQQI